MTPLHARVLDGVGGARQATEAETNQASASDGVLWIHVDYEQEDIAQWLQEAAGLDEVTTEALLADAPRPRTLPTGEGLLVILRGINVNTGASADDMVSLRMWLEEGRVISLRHRRLASVAEICEELDRGQGPTESGDLLHRIVERMLDRIGTVVDEIEEAVDNLEEQVLTAESREIRSQISNLRRQTISLRRYLAPQRDTLARLHTERVAWMTELSRARLREAADRIIRHLEALDAARERAAVTYEELSNRLAEQMNQTMYVLSIVAAIFLPLGLLTGLFGINVGGMPGTDDPGAFGVVCALLVVLGVLEWAWFKRNAMI